MNWLRRLIDTILMGVFILAVTFGSIYIMNTVIGWGR